VAGVAAVSAQDHLILALAEHPCCFSTEDAEKLVNAYAHELAEKIRASGRNDVCAGVDCCQPHGGAADLIDPQAGT